MSRIVVAQDTAEGSFAGLLEHLTRRSGTSGLESGFVSRTGSASASIASATSSGRSGTRALTPVTESKTAPDSVQLSYEQALRMHARRRPTTVSGLELQAVDLKKPTADGNDGREAATDTREDRAARKGRISKTAAKVAGSAAPTEPQSAASLRLKPAPTSSPRPNARHKKSAAGLMRSGDLRSSSPRLPASPDTHSVTHSVTHSPATVSSARRKPKASVRAKPDSTKPGSTKSGSNDSRANPRPTPPPSAAQGAEAKTAAWEYAGRLTESKSLAKVERNDLQLEQILLLDQRTATVSVRLTDIEFLRLKERAGESGISVSAYMRSCILDADELRAQVKRALAEMRAVARPEPNLLPAPQSGESSDTAPRGDWFRGVMRYAAFLLSPIFPFRRSA